MKCIAPYNEPAVYSTDKNGNRTVLLSKCLHNAVKVGT